MTHEKLRDIVLITGMVLVLLFAGFTYVWGWAQQNLIARSQLVQAVQQCNTELQTERAKHKEEPKK